MCVRVFGTFCCECKILAVATPGTYLGSPTFSPTAFFFELLALCSVPVELLHITFAMSDVQTVLHKLDALVAERRTQIDDKHKSAVVWFEQTAGTIASLLHQLRIFIRSSDHPTLIADLTPHPVNLLLPPSSHCSIRVSLPETYHVF
jgi:hypothetical protein